MMSWQKQEKSPFKETAECSVIFILASRRNHVEFSTARDHVARKSCCCIGWLSAISLVLLLTEIEDCIVVDCCDNNMACQDEIPPGDETTRTNHQRSCQTTIYRRAAIPSTKQTRGRKMIMLPPSSIRGVRCFNGESGGGTGQQSAFSRGHRRNSIVRPNETLSNRAGRLSPICEHINLFMNMLYVQRLAAPLFFLVLPTTVLIIISTS